VDIVIRPAGADDFAEIARLDGVSFGMQYEDEDLTDLRTVLDLDRFLVATDDAQIVGVTGDYPFELSVPGGQLDVPGVTWVSVSPTHRRRGILSGLMHRQLSGYLDAGVPLAILTASEGGIYGRFGYGPASQVRKTVIDRRRALLSRSGDAGRVEVVTAERARAQAPEVHRRWRELTPGSINRTDAWWDLSFLDRGHQRGGLSRKFHLLHPDGYLGYRVRSDWADGHPAHTCWITDYFPASAAAHADLWTVLLGLDLFGRIESFQIPVDDPLAHLLADYRQVRTEALNDGLWVRPLDIPAMLSTRRYAVEVEVVLDVVDPVFGDGRFLLTGGPDGARCGHSDRAADVTLGAAALGASYLGGTRLAGLANAGQVRSDDPAVLSRLDRALLADRAPFHGTGF